jgi:hypothetical protein
MYIWFAASSFGKVNKILLATIGVLFITWGFNKWVGMLGITTTLAFCWLQHLKSQRVTREDIQKQKESIIAHYDNLYEEMGKAHYKFLYDNAQFILHTNNTLTVTFINYTVKLGLVIISLYSVWNSDWISLIACIILVISTRWFSAKQLRFHKYIFGALESGGNAMDELTELIQSYLDFLNSKNEDDIQNN